MNNTNSEHILIVDDEPLIRKSLHEVLSIEGYQTMMASCGNEALEKINQNSIDIVITDLKMPDINGITLLKTIKKKHPQIAVILITGHGNIETAVEAMKFGAFDYITKPVVDNEIKIIINKIRQQKKLVKENISLRKQLAQTQRDSFAQMIGASSQMQKIYTMIEAIADTKATVLITGESGTGKRLVALAIHENDNSRRNNRFVEVSCGALPENLLESELFGHIKGAFTGAIRDRTGRFELADKGTLFLDEIDAFGPPLQVKLLRAIQEGEFENVGSAETTHSDTRIIAATNQNLEKLIKEGAFREDLFYRLNVISIDLPPLRDKKEDIPQLINHFINKYNKRNKTKVTGISDETLKFLCDYDWPGNVRQLENAIEHALVIAKSDKITKAHLPQQLLRNKKYSTKQGKKPLKEVLGEPEKQIILDALNTCNWNRKKTAESLSINRCTLYNKMKRYSINASK